MLQPHMVDINTVQFVTYLRVLCATLKSGLLTPDHPISGKNCIRVHVATSLRMLKGRKRSLSQPGAAAIQGTAQLRNASLPGAALPLRGASSSRTQALATFHGLVAAGGDSGAAGLHSTPSHAAAGGQAPTPLAAAPARAASTTAGASAPSSSAPNPLAAAAGTYTSGMPLQPLPLAPSAAPAAHDPQPWPAAAAVPPASPLGAARAAQQLPRALDMLRGCAAQLAQPGGSYLYQRHEQLTAARQQLDACLSCLPPLLASGGGGVVGGGRRGHLAQLLLKGSACCWVGAR